MMRRNTPVLRWLSIFIAMLLMIMPMPVWLAALRPFFVAQVLIFWILETPNKMRFGRVFLIGIVLDLMCFNTLGEYALRLLLLAGIVHQLRNQFRFFPVWQQAIILLLLMFVDLLMQIIIRQFQAQPMPVPLAWLSPVLAFITWPWIYMWLDNLRLQNRSK